MANDADVTEWIDDIIKKNAEVSSEASTLEQAKKLLMQWSNQTETFSMQPQKNPPKIAKYRKLDTPMMVAKKTEPIRPSADPTILMEARRAHVEEMKKKRLERMATRSETQACAPYADSVINVPDITTEINQKRAKIEEKLKIKQKELQDRVRKSLKVKEIERCAAKTVALEEEEKRKKAEKEDIEAETQKEKEIAAMLTLFIQKMKQSNLRKFYSVWSSRCSFRTRSYDRAARFNDFHVSTLAFSTWKKRFQSRLRQKELEELDRALRNDKRLEETSESLFRKKNWRKFFIRWRAVFKAAVERKISEEVHKKRRDELVKKIEERPKEAEEPKQQTPPKKTKVLQLKTDPKLEAMEKRMEEQREKRLEKLRIEVDKEEAEQSQRLKEEYEINRKKKIDHMKFLEEERQKRDEQKKMQKDYEEMVKRKKRLEEASKALRQKSLLKMSFGSWKRIGPIMNAKEDDAEVHFHHSLQKCALRSLKKNLDEEIEKKEKSAESYARDKMKRICFLWWLRDVEIAHESENSIEENSKKWKMRRCLQKMCAEKKKKRKEKFVGAIQFSNLQALRKAIRAWPIGCRVIKDDGERKQVREELMDKALRMLGELSDD